MPAAVLLGAVLLVVGALGQRWWQTSGDLTRSVPKLSAATPAKLAAAGAHAPSTTVIDNQLLADVLGIVDKPQREEIVNSAERFKQFVGQEVLNHAVLQAATINKANQNPQIKTIMARAAQRVMVDAYLNQVVQVNLDPKFPSAAQVREAYDKNPTAFRTPERVHLWQIFIPLDAGASDKDIKAAWTRANRLASDLRTSGGDFAALAKQHSGHEASRVNDGYMGLLNSAELLPPIAEAVKKLKPNAVSEPIASDTGLHILKRGTQVAAETLSFERVEEQLRARMVQEAMAKVRQAAIEKIAKEYAIATPSAQQLETWRQALLTPAAAATPE